MRFERWFYTVLLRIRSLFKRSVVEDDINDELQYHLDRQIEQNVADGLSPEDARYAALRTFGNTTATRERLRAIGGWSSLEALTNDVRYGLRLLRRSPMFAAFAIASLSLGIGATGAIFSLLNAIVLRELPVKNPEQLVSLYITMPGRPPNWSLPYPQFEAMRARNTSLDGLIAISPIGRVSVSNGGHPELSSAEAVSGDYFRVLGLQPSAGKLLAADDDAPANATAVISHGYWQRRFGGRPSVIGSQIFINRQPFTIVGVAPKGFLGAVVGSPADIAIPMRALDVLNEQGAPWGEAFSTWIYIVGRLKDGESFQRAEQELDLIYKQVAAAAAQLSPPAERSTTERLARDVRLKIDSAATGTASGLRATYQSSLQLLLMLISAVVLMASLNVGTLLLSRSQGRQREIATRLALGAGRARIVRQLLTESLLLAALAGIIGLFISSWGSRILLRMALPSASELPVDLTLDLRVVLFMIAVSALACLAFGLIPALRTTSPQRLNLASREIAVTRRRSSLDRALVVAQVALSLVILVSAGLFARSLQSLWLRDTGYDRENVLMFSVDAGLAGRQPPEAGAAYRNILQELQTLPNVQSATVSVVRPVSGDFYLVDRVTQIGDRALPDDQRIRVAFDSVAPGYFYTLRIPLLAGREFEEQDNEPASRTVIISETMARRHFANESPVGQFISLGRDRRQIIGVAADVRYANVKDAPREVVYRPIFQAPARFHVSFQVRYRGATEEALQRIRGVVSRTEPALAMFNVRTLDAQTADSLARENLLALLSSYFAVFAVLLMCIGLYGLLNYSVARRTPEFGLRMALGAKSRTLYWMILRESFATVLVGAVAGIAGSLAVTRLLQTQLFDIGPYDPVAFAAATFLLMTMAVVASIIPAARASRIDPMTALKYE
ncbi:MAG: ABC transporter permease [Acidobacteria bacterium]|nr:ABC transporter permease [Acidobacteriota bacterium]